MNVIKSAGRLLFANTLNSILMFIGITYFARRLGASEIGVFFLFQAMLGVLSVFADFGIRGAAEKRISGRNEPGQYFAGALIIKGIFLLVILVLSYFFAATINEYVGRDIALYLPIALIFSELAQLLVQSLNAELRVAETAPILLARQISWLASSISFVYIGYAATGLILGIIVSNFVIILLAGYISNIKLAAPDISHLRSLFKYGKYDFISGTGSQMFGWLDLLVVGYFLASNLVGAYEISWKVAALPLLFSKSIYTAIFPKISNLHKGGKMREVEDLTSSMVLPTVYFVIPALFGSLVISEEILAIIFGSEYTVAAIILPVFMLHKLTVAYDQVIGRTLQALNHPDYAAIAMVLGIIANILLNISLIWKYGILGGAVATFISFLIVLTIKYFYLSKIINIPLIPPGVVWCTCSSILMAIVLLAIKNVVQINNLVSILSLVGIGAIVYVLASVLSKEVREMYVENIISG